MSLLNILSVFMVLTWMFRDIKATTFNASSPCVPRFYTHREEFAPCLKQMTGPEHTKLFPCKNRKALFPELSGISFEIHQEINFEALCVWGGSECGFNDMVNFASNHANDTATKQYQFGAQGLVAQLPYRITPTLLPTVTVSREPYVLIKAIKEGSETGNALTHTVFQAFQPATWVSLLGLFGGLLMFAGITTYIFTKSLSPIAVLTTMMGECPEDDKLGEPNRRAKRTSIMLVSYSMKLGSVSFIFTFLVHTLTCNDSVLSVNLLFSPQVSRLPKPIAELTNKELQKFGVHMDSAPENILRNAVDPERKRFPVENGKSYPWTRCRVTDDCYDKFLNPDDPMVYMIVYKPEGLYSLKTRLACDKLIVLDSSKAEHSFGGSSGLPYGWYMSTAVPEAMHIQVNKELIHIQCNGAFKKMVAQKTENGGVCGATKKSISPEVLLTPLGFVILPNVIVAFVLMIQYAFTEEKGHDDFDFEDTHHLDDMVK